MIEYIKIIGITIIALAMISFNAWVYSKNDTDGGMMSLITLIVLIFCTIGISEV